MEDYGKILLWKMLGQRSAVTFQNLFSKPRRSTCFNKMCFLSTERKRGHGKGLVVKNVRVPAARSVSAAPTPTADGCPRLHHPSTQTCASAHLRSTPRRRLTNRGARRHRKNYSLGDFPHSLNHSFYFRLQHRVQKADRHHPTSH